MRNYFIPVIAALVLAVALIWVFEIATSHTSEIKSADDLVVYLEIIIIGFLIVGMVCDKAIKYMAEILNSIYDLRIGARIELEKSDYTHQFVVLFGAAAVSVAIYQLLAKF